MTTPATPKGRGAGYRAAEYLHHNKITTISQADLFLVVNFGTNHSIRVESMDRAIASGWLIDAGGGKIDIGPAARAHFDSLEAPAKKYVGQVATPRVPLRPFQACPPISQKNIPNIHGPRDDVPVFSVRERAHFPTQA
jgi:hypothetical protein